MAHAPTSTLAAAPSRSLLVALPIALSALVYFPITGNYFMRDDFIFLYRIVDWNRLEFLLTQHGGHILIARNALFWLFYALFGTAASWYFAVVLLTHLLNVYLLFAVLHGQTGNAPLACFGAALWGTCRVNEGALGWYAVYGQVVAATCFLWFLHRLTRIGAGAPQSRCATLRWMLLLGVAATSFGTGLAMALVSPLLAWLLLPASRLRTVTVRALCAVSLAVPPLYVGTQRVATYLYGTSSSFPLLLATVSNPAMVGSFTAGLSLSGIAGLCLGVFAPAGAFNPTSLLVATLLMTGTVAVLARAPTAVRRRVAAYAIGALVCYGSVALGRGLFRSGAVGASRYQYMALLPVVLLLCEVVGFATSFLRAAQAAVLVVAALATPLLSYRSYSPPLDPAAAARRETEVVFQRIQIRANAQPGNGPVCIRNEDFGSAKTRNPTRALFPGWAALYAIFEPRNEIAGRRIYFLEEDEEVLAAAARGRRTADLIAPLQQFSALGCREPVLGRMKRPKPPP